MSDGWTPPTDPAAQPGGTPAWTPPPGPQPGAAPPPPGSWGGPPQWGQQNAPWGAAPAARPGIIPLRPLGLGEILDGAFAVIRHYPKVTLGTSAIVVSLTQLVVLWLTRADLTGESVDSVGFEITGRQFSSWLVSGVAGMLLAGLLAPVVGQAVLGREATFRTTWGRVRPVFGRLVLASIVAGTLPWFGAVALLVPGAFLWGAFALTTPALVMEHLGVGASIRRSWRLGLPDFWRVWGTRALSAIVGVVLATIISAPAGIFAAWQWNAMDPTDAGEALSASLLVVILLANILAYTITAPFAANVLALLYVDRRMRAEGLDVTLAQSAATQGYAPPAAPAWPPPAGPR